MHRFPNRGFGQREFVREMLAHLLVRHDGGEIRYFRHQFVGHPLRFRDLEEIVQEMAAFPGIGVVTITAFESDGPVARKDRPFVHADQDELLAIDGAIYGFVLLSQEFLYGFFADFGGIQQKGVKSLLFRRYDVHGKSPLLFGRITL